jgi:hypothetical protein
MFPNRRRAMTLATVSGLFVALVYTSTAQSLPQKISDRDFWTMISSFSEGGGEFVSDNVISNEIEFQRVIPHLLATSRGGVYVGVARDSGPCLIQYGRAWSRRPGMKSRHIVNSSPGRKGHSNAS